MIKRIIASTIKSVKTTLDHDAIEHSGYIAFLTLLSFFPFLIFFFAIIGKLGNIDIVKQLVSILLVNMPEYAANAIKPRIDEIVSGPPQGLMTIAIVGIIWTASSAVEGLRTALNRAYNISNTPVYIVRRLMSIGHFLLLTFIVIITLVVMIFLPIVIKKSLTLLSFININILDYSFVNTVISHSWVYIKYSVSSFILLVALSTIYYIIPNVKQNIRMILPGALFAVILWLIAGRLFAIYLTHFNQVNLIYGSLAGIIVSLLFFHFMAMILIFGAEFNYNFYHYKKIKREHEAL